MKHVSIIPLIGGETLGTQKAFGTLPDYLLSYKAFWPNDQHLVNYYSDNVPYYVLDNNQTFPHKVDVVGSVCPCAGLSQLSQGYGDHNKNNDWLLKTTAFVLTEMKPEVFWGENAPGLAGKIGENIRTEMREMGLANGYSMTLYRTKSLLHGVPQVRERAFFFFWKGDKCPQLNFYNRPHIGIEELILNVKSNFQTEPINPKIPSVDDPYYRYVLESMYGGITHRQFFDMVEPAKVRNNDICSYIEKAGHDYRQVGAWMQAHAYTKEAEKCERKYQKLSSGGQIMRRGTIVAKDYIGAFVGQYPTMLTHPHEDRYINYREAMSIMGLPEDFELISPRKNFNHICQNVPVDTAADMAFEIKEYLSGNRPMINSNYVFQYNHNERIEFAPEQNKEKFNTLEEFI